MNATVSIRVTPGSDTLWSVHSGHRRWTIRFASSTRSWKRRSSRFGVGSTSASGARRGVLGDGVEGEDEVARVVRAPQGVVHVDVQQPALRLVVPDGDVPELDARLP